MTNVLVSLLVGAMFGAGLLISGMTQPAKVIGFLDVTGGWDPSLAFVLVGAIVVHALAYRLVPRLRAPLLAERFGIPTRKDIDPKLITGAALFGAGWGLGGYCPGPALTSVTAGASSTVIFTAAMLTGMWGHALWEAARRKESACSVAPCSSP